MHTGMGKGENTMLAECEWMYSYITDNVLCGQAFQACPLSPSSQTHSDFQQNCSNIEHLKQVFLSSLPPISLCLTNVFLCRDVEKVRASHSYIRGHVREASHFRAMFPSCRSLKGSLALSHCRGRREQLVLTGCERQELCLALASSLMISGCKKVRADLAGFQANTVSGLLPLTRHLSLPISLPAQKSGMEQNSSSLD